MNHISISVVQAELCKGDQLDGVVMLMLKQNYPGDAIMVDVKGTEETNLVEKKQSERDKKVFTLVTHHQKINILNFSTPVKTFDAGVLPAGLYEIPFSFILP